MLLTVLLGGFHCLVNPLLFYFLALVVWVSTTLISESYAVHFMLENGMAALNLAFLPSFSGLPVMHSTTLTVYAQ